MSDGARAFVLTVNNNSAPADRKRVLFPAEDGAQIQYSANQGFEVVKLQLLVKNDGSGDRWYICHTSNLNLYASQITIIKDSPTLVASV